MTDCTIPNALEAMLNISRTAEESELETAHASAVAALGGIYASDELRHRIASTLDELLEARLGICRTCSPDFDPVRAHLHGPPGSLSYLHRQRQAVRRLQAQLDQLGGPLPRADGYTAGELMKYGEISKTLWREIRLQAGIQVGRGDSHRRFSNNEIRRLIVAARRRGKRKGEQAAQGWERLLAANQ